MRVTRRFIEKNGFDDLLPIAFYDATAVLAVLEGYPEEIVPPEVVHEWASGRADGAPYVVAFKLDATHFRVDSVSDGQTTEDSFEV